MYACDSLLALLITTSLVSCFHEGFHFLQSIHPSIHTSAVVKNILIPAGQACGSNDDQVESILEMLFGAQVQKVEPGAAAAYGYDPNEDHLAPLSQTDSDLLELSQMWSGILPTSFHL